MSSFNYDFYKISSEMDNPIDPIGFEYDNFDGPDNLGLFYSVRGGDLHSTSKQILSVTVRESGNDDRMGPSLGLRLVRPDFE